MPIHILPPEVANQIAAGEVVERPASAVKELIENSLDAGATDVRVEVREGGRRLLRVQDDGCGIPAAEVALAFQRHATSKITTAADLNRITTLGFRGEALASIAAVAQVTLLTRTRDEETGALIRLAEGREVAREPAGGPPGTVVTVEHLFANVPARLKFLKQPATEAGHIQQIVTRYALAYPERRFSLVSDGKLLFQSTGSGKLYDVLVKVYGLEMAREMLPVGAEEQGSRGAEELVRAPRPSCPPAPLPGIRVTGYIGSPTLHRGNRGYITLFVNRRWFQDTSVAYSVIQAYHTMLPVGRYPVAVLFIELDPADVDVNVHPTKAEVRFRDNHAIFSAVQKAVRRTLADLAPIPQVGLTGTAATAPSADGAWPATPPFGGPAWSERRDALLGAGRDQGLGTRDQGLGTRDQGLGTRDQGLGTRDQELALGHEFPVPSPQSLVPSRQSLAPSPQSLVPSPQSLVASRQSLVPLLRVVGQLAATYIVAEGPDGMYLIDQHAAHERILYEQLSAQRMGHTLAVQPLLEPLLLDLSPEQAAVVAEELDILNELGVGIEPFGGGSYLVRSIPAILSRENPAAALTEIVDGLATQNDVVEGTADAALTTLICKRAAVKGGHPLTLAEMQELVRQLEACRTPRTCPHGRPTMIYLSGDELARQFGRT